MGCTNLFRHVAPVSVRLSPCPLCRTRHQSGFASPLRFAPAAPSSCHSISPVLYSVPPPQLPDKSIKVHSPSAAHPPSKCLLSLHSFVRQALTPSLLNTPSRRRNAISKSTFRETAHSATNSIPLDGAQATRFRRGPAQTLQSGSHPNIRRTASAAKRLARHPGGRQGSGKEAPSRVFRGEGGQAFVLGTLGLEARVSPPASGGWYGKHGSCKMRGAELRLGPVFWGGGHGAPRVLRRSRPARNDVSCLLGLIGKGGSRLAGTSRFPKPTPFLQFLPGPWGDLNDMRFVSPAEPSLFVGIQPARKVSRTI